MREREHARRTMRSHKIRSRPIDGLVRGHRTASLDCSAATFRRPLPSKLFAAQPYGAHQEQTPRQESHSRLSRAISASAPTSPAAVIHALLASARLLRNRSQAVENFLRPCRYIGLCILIANGKHPRLPIARSTEQTFGGKRLLRRFQNCQNRLNVSKLFSSKLIDVHIRLITDGALSGYGFELAACSFRLASTRSRSHSRM